MKGVYLGVFLPPTSSPITTLRLNINYKLIGHGRLTPCSLLHLHSPVSITLCIATSHGLAEMLWHGVPGVIDDVSLTPPSFSL